MILPVVQPNPPRLEKTVHRQAANICPLTVVMTSQALRRTLIHA